MRLKDEELIEFTRQLVQRPSLSGKEQDVAEYIKTKLEELGFEEVRTDDMGSVTGCIKGNKPGKTILLDGHMDTVSPLDTTKWAHHPYSGEIEDGKIFGRGTTDMKGSLASMIFSIARFMEKKKADFSGEIHIACTVYEEVFEGVACKQIVKEIKPDMVIIGEATTSTIKIGQRGRAEIQVETFGKTGHSSHPENGINAVLNMNKFINELKKLKLTNHEILGEGILEITDIMSNPYPGDSMIPETCQITLDRRTLVGEKKKNVLKQVQDIVERLRESDTQFDGKAYLVQGEGYCYTGKRFKSERFYPAWIIDKEEKLVQAAISGLERAGIQTELSHFDFCTNGSYYCGKKKIPTIGYGPSKENIAHTIDEYITIEELTKSCKGFESILEELTN
ncbi:MAG: YgeY family selenium metabolism-linked hydrolase [Gallicola sp.]|nr:YgeY family selenium metabolism-linked hydrolase [Gallicola sp.]